MPDEGRMPEPPSDEEIEARLRRVRQELSEIELPDLSDEEVDRKAQELQGRLSDLKRSSLPDVPEWDYKRPKVKKEDRSHYRGLGVGFSVAYSMLGCVLAGWGLGKLADLATHGVLGQAIGTLLGGIAALVSAILLITKQGEKDK